MKDDYHNLNKLLRFYIDNVSEVAVAPDVAAEKANVQVDKTTAFLMCRLMFDDGYLDQPSENLARYEANYKAKLFLDEGGYVTQKRIADRKRYASWMVETFDFLKYPLGIVLAILGLYKLIIELNLIEVLKGLL
ncbi:MAG: hypothetical protein H6602_10310 [Flavobacteriales bacterium]|nr:hypothetical protein [Flavobacteriales bacterium]